MKNRLLQLQKGMIDTDRPVLELEKEALSGILPPDKRLSVDIGLKSLNRIPLHLFFYSTDPRIAVSRNVAVSTYAKLTVEIDTTGLCLGDRLEGAVDIVYNGGEARIPYDFTVGMAKDDASEFAFQTGEEFREFARKDPDSAIRIFSWHEFLLMPFMQDLHLQGLYAAYYSESAPAAGLFEFMKAAGFSMAEADEAPDAASENKRSILRPASTVKSAYLKRNYLLESAFLKLEAELKSGKRPEENDDDFRKIYRIYPEDDLVILLHAYDCIRTGELKKAKDLLLKVQDEVQKERLEKRDVYCLFTVLAGMVQDDGARYESTRALIRKYWLEGSCTLLMAILEYRTNPDYAADYGAAAEFLRNAWIRGMKHAWVLRESAELFMKGSVNFAILTDYELSVLLYGIRKEILSEQKLFEMLGHELKNPKFLRMYTEVLKEGYYRFRNIELLQAVMNVFMQKKWVGARYFEWYREAVRREMTITGLYDAFMNSMPKDYQRPLPSSLVKHYGYAREAYNIPLSLLYSNVLTEYDHDNEIMTLYRDKITSFALRAMKENSFSPEMKPIYERVLSREYLDESTAKYMLRLFSLYTVKTALSEGARIVVHYPQLDKEEFYPLIRNEAMVPVFSEEAILAVEDQKGRRHFDPLLTKTQIFSDEELRKQCALYVDDSLLLRIREADRIVKEGVFKDRELFMVTEFIKDKRITPFYRSRLYESLIDLSLDPSMQHIDCAEFLLQAEFKDFTRAYRVKLLTALIEKNYLDLALEKVLTYGAEGLSPASYRKLLDYAVHKELMEGSPVILAHVFRLFKLDEASNDMMQFLAKYFRGSSRDMLSVVRTLRKKHQNTRGLVGATLTVLVYTDNTREIDSLFEAYLLENDRDETIVKACLVLRAHDSFINGRKLTDLAFDMLMKRRQSLPPVALFALITRYSEEADTLSSEERETVVTLLRECLNLNVYLACFRKFSRFPDLPFELRNRHYVEIREKAAKQIAVTGFVQPARHYFHRMMQEVYPGVFVQSFILYHREWLQYAFRMRLKDGSTKETEGEMLVNEDAALQNPGRDADLQNLDRKIRDDNDRDTMDTLRNMLLKEGMTKELFRNE